MSALGTSVEQRRGAIRPPLAAGYVPSHLYSLASWLSTHRTRRRPASEQVLASLRREFEESGARRRLGLAHYFVI